MAFKPLLVIDEKESMMSTMVLRDKNSDILIPKKRRLSWQEYWLSTTKKKHANF